MTQCVAVAKRDDVVIGRIRAAEVTAGDVSHGSRRVNQLKMMQREACSV